MRIIFEQKKQTHHYATLKKNGLTFEVIVIPDKVIEFRRGLITDVREALEFEMVYSDAKKAEEAADLEKNFGTNDVLKVAGEIIREGVIQLTADYKKQLQQQKMKEVINIISRNGIDPRTSLPIPETRIDLAIKQVVFNFDPFKSAEEQVEPLLEKIRPILPIRFEQKEIEGLIPQKYASRVMGVVKKYGEITRSNWKNDGSLEFAIKVPGGLSDEFMKTLNNLTHGEANITLR